MNALKLVAILCLGLPGTAFAQTGAPGSGPPKADDPSIGSPQMPASMGNGQTMKPEASRKSGTAPSSQDNAPSGRAK